MVIKKLKEKHIHNLDVLASLYQMVIERSHELEIDLKCHFVPMQNLPNAIELEDYSEYFLNCINKPKNEE